MKKAILFPLVLLSAQIAVGREPAVKTGIEGLQARGFDVLKGKRIALITNPTGVDSRLRSTIDILFEAKGLQLVALFGPEHGVRGDIPGGERIESYTDPQTNLPVYSLYGRTHKPNAEMLKDIDVLVYDIQDIGCRSYTYITTMGLAMEAAAEHSIEFVVLDRPNPLGGTKIEGNPVQKGFESFIGRFPIPYVYGLTCGELARMLNEEGMLTNGVRCKLTVIPMQGWKRSMTFTDTGLPWVATSPHIPSESTPPYYVSTGILGELGVISEGVGYTLPFRILAAEWIDQKRIADKLNGLGLQGILFRPMTVRPFYGKFKDKDLHGVQVHITDYSKVDLMAVQFRFMEVHNELYPDKNPFKLADSGRIQAFDKAAGTDEVRKLFARQMKFDDVRDYLDRGVDEFRKKSKRYLLYD